MIALLVRVGLGEALSRRLAPFVWVAAALAMFGLLWAAWLHFHDREVIRQHEATVEAKAANARETAAAERAEDAAANTRQEEKYNAAIQSVEDGPPSAAAVALNCERLRRIGRIPPACRPTGGDRSETAAQ